MARLVPIEVRRCTHCGEPLALAPRRCVNEACPLSSFAPDPTFGSDYDEED